MEQKVWRPLTPENLQECILRRLETAAKINDSKKLQATAWLHLENDPVAFINDWCWTFDPRLVSRKGIPAHVPFLLFDIQIELVEFIEMCWEKQIDGLVEKSRDMGWSWVVLAVMLHKLIFVENFTAILASREAKLVDKLGQMNALMPKMRFLLETLPPWLRPCDPVTGELWSKDDSRHSKLNQITNPAKGGVITGEAGDNIGRGGRGAIAILDEHAAMDGAEETEAALSQTVDVRLYGSSARGMSNLFYKKRMSGNIEVFTMHWRSDPRKDDVWYNLQKKKFKTTPWVVPQEIDLDYSAGVQGVMIPGEWVKACVDYTCPHEVWTKFKPLASLDVADGGGDANVLLFQQGPKTHLPHEWFEGTSLQTATKTSHLLRSWTSPDGQRIEKFTFDSVGVGASVAGYFDMLDMDEGDRPADFAAAHDFETIPYKGGYSPSETLWEDVDKTSQEMFFNLRAESWWLLRSRCEKTFEKVHGIQDHPDEECLDLPAEAAKLIMEISTPKYFVQNNDKILIESKKQMAKRGASSPNQADALTQVLAIDVIQTDLPFIGRI